MNEAERELQNENDARMSRDELLIMVGKLRDAGEIQADAATELECLTQQAMVVAAFYRNQLIKARDHLSHADQYVLDEQLGAANDVMDQIATETFRQWNRAAYGTPDTCTLTLEQLSTLPEQEA